ncbi:MAG: hypothetical protein ACRD6N_00560 [Pyrinomonadaceae bacterium]
MTKKKWQARTKQALIVEVWEQLDCESVGAPEIEEIQQEISIRFGEGAVESPASIARTLADEGAVLRHPEVLNCDTAWRESEIAKLEFFDRFHFSSLTEAAESMQKLEARRRELAGDGLQEQLRVLREVALDLKQQAKLLVRSKIVDQRDRAIAEEVAQWLTIWLTEPDMFEDWLSLRQRSPEFIEKFGS